MSELWPNACDACKRRKVRCNRTDQCSQCTHLGLRCIYSRAASRTRRAIIRGGVIQAYRDELLLPKEPARIVPIPQTPDDILTGADFFVSLRDDYESHTLPLLPVVPLSEYDRAVQNLHTNSASTSMLYVLAATTLTMTIPGCRDQGMQESLTRKLCYGGLEKRGVLLPDHKMTVETILVSLLTSPCIFLRDPNAPMGWYYFNEAVTCTSLLYQDSISRDARLERLYWIIWIHERFNAIARRRRPVLQTLASAPAADSSFPAGVSTGFNQLIQLWKSIDDVFVQHWLDNQPPSLTHAWIEFKQAELSDNIDEWEQGTEVLSHRQQLDLIITRRWIQTLLWQMALSRFLLKSGYRVEGGSMGLTFPAHISHRLRVVLSSTPRGMSDAHGSGAVHKSFDIVLTLADLLEHVLHATCDAETIAEYLDDFSFMYKFLMSMQEFHEKDRVLLSQRYTTLCAIYPLWACRQRNVYV